MDTGWMMLVTGDRVRYNTPNGALGTIRHPGIYTLDGIQAALVRWDDGAVSVANAKSLEYIEGSILWEE